MKFGSTGTPVASPSLPRADRQAGFTLIEALASLTLVLAFAAVLGPLLAQGRRIMINADGRVAAQIKLRALLQGPLDRTALTSFAREGETEGLQWRVAAEPTAVAASLPPAPPAPAPSQQVKSAPAKQSGPWVAYRVIASVSWAPGESVSAETIRLGKTE
jgi:Prokaryotic N-terminal methylation motif